MPRKSRSLAERFWPKVDQSGDGCWPWTGARYSNGYGALSVRGANGRRTTALVHRVSWFLAYGPIPAGFKVLHRCDNKPCARPDHLFLGTDRDNMADMRAKGRAFEQREPERHRAVVQRSGGTAGRMGKGKPKPVKNGKSNYAQKLNEQLVAEIRMRRARDNTPYSRLAKEYGVRIESIQDICYRITWKHVP